MLTERNQARGRGPGYLQLRYWDAKCLLSVSITERNQRENAGSERA